MNVRGGLEFPFSFNFGLELWMEKKKGGDKDRELIN